MRRLAPVLLICTGLAACGSDTWLGENAPPPLPGKRISILSHSQALEADSGGVGTIVLPPPDRVADWPQAGGFPPHAMHHLALGEHPKEVWRADIGHGNDDRHVLLTTPVVAGGKVFTTDSLSEVAAFDLKTGARLWRNELTPDDADSGSFGGGLAVEGDKVFVTTGFAQLVSLDAVNGKILWRQALPAPVRGAPTVRGGRVMLITVENETIALSAEDGHTLWHHVGLSEPAAMMGGSSPAVDGNVVLSPYTSGELFALRIENGSVLWSELFTGVKRTDQVSTLTDIRGLPVVDRGRVYAAGNSDMAAAIDLRTGRRIWDREVGSTQTPWVAGDFVYLLTTAPELVCFEAQSGRIRWVAPLPHWKDEEGKKGRISWSGPVLASDRLIIASSEGQLMSLSPYTGTVLGTEEMDDPVFVPPIVADNTLLLVTEGGDLVAYR